MEAERKARLGTKWTCYSCGVRFYDLNKPEPLCPKCEADQRESPAFQEKKTKPRKAARKKTPKKKAAKKSREKVPTLDDLESEPAPAAAAPAGIGLDSIDGEDETPEPAAEEVEID